MDQYNLYKGALRIINGKMNAIDIWFNQKAVLLQTPLLDKIMIFITNIASPVGIIALSAILLIVLFYCKKKRHALLLACSMGSGVLLTSLIKMIVQRARPENALIQAQGYSFPSGHATAAVIFFTLIIYAFKDYIKNRILNKTFITANITLFLLIGFSRVYLNVHWFTDVIAGFGLGIILLMTFNTSKTLNRQDTTNAQICCESICRKTTKKFDCSN